MKKRVLITGFPPFGKSTVNSSIMACNNLNNLAILDLDIIAAEIPLHYKEIKSSIEKAVEEIEPSIVIATGQSNRSRISIERVAINIADVNKVVYNCGSKPADERLIEDGSAAFFSTLPIKKIRTNLEVQGIPCEISNTAGTFGCNQIFYYLMHYLKHNEKSIPAGFIHVPSLPKQVIGKLVPSMSIDLITKSLKIAIETTIIESR